MGLSYLTPPVCEPLHVADVRQHVKQDITDDDNLIALYLASARAWAEDYTRKQFIAARLEYRVDGFPNQNGYMPYLENGGDVNWPGNALLLPKGPLIEVESIQYLDTAGVQQTMPATDYKIDSRSEPARITPVFGKIWPIAKPEIGSVWVTYKAGFVCKAAFDAAADTVALTNWKTLSVNDPLRFSVTGGSLPAELTAKTDYYVQGVVSPGVYTLAATPGGALINLTTAGSGLQFAAQPGINFSNAELPPQLVAWLLLRCDTAYSHRGENVNTRGGEIKPLPYVDRLLDHVRLW